MIMKRAESFIFIFKGSIKGLFTKIAIKKIIDELIFISLECAIFNFDNIDISLKGSFSTSRK